jgi:hypothetical protein
VELLLLCSTPLGDSSCLISGRLGGGAEGNLRGDMSEDAGSLALGDVLGGKYCGAGSIDRGDEGIVVDVVDVGVSKGVAKDVSSPGVVLEI